MTASSRISFLFLACLGGLVAALAQDGTALVRHAPTLNGSVDGSIHQMTAESVTLNSGANVTGRLFVPGLPVVRLNGSPIYGGTSDGSGASTPVEHRVTLNSGARLGQLVRRTDPVALPTVVAPPLPAGTRSVSLNRSGQLVGGFTTLRNLTLNSNVGQIAVPPGTYGNFNANSGSGFTLGLAGATTPAVYNFQNLTLNSNSSFTVAGPVIVTVNGGFSTNTNLGNSSHPEWLKLCIAGGGLSIASNRAVYAHLAAPGGTLTLNGGSRFVGAVASDRLIVNSNSLLQLVAPPATNLAPAVAIVQPVGQVRLLSPGNLTLVAAATDADGTVARVEFFQDDQKLGEDDLAPFTFALTLATPGTHVFTVRAVDNLGASAASATLAVVVTSAPSVLPFVTDFESSEGYQVGPLHGQQGWIASDGVQVLAAANGPSAFEVNVPGASPAESLELNILGGDASPVFTDVLVQPIAATISEEAVIVFTPAAQVALAGMGSSAVLHAAQASTGGLLWNNTGYEVAVDADLRGVTRLRLTLREDFLTRKWDLYADGRMIAADLPFTDPAVASAEGFALVGHEQHSTRMDDFYVGTENPLFADADHDGMSDAWENTHDLNPALNDRNGDADFDGLSNILEHLFGTSPSQSDSDGDGLPDAWEHHHGLNPTQPNPAESDADADGLSDLQEFVAGTHPSRSDTDGDGLPDAWEILYGLNPLLANDDLADSDGDGLSDRQEYQHGKDPTDFFNGILPRLTSRVASDGTLGPGNTLSILVTNEAGEPLANAPVRFTATSGGHLLAVDSAGPVAVSITVRTGSNGVAIAYVKPGEN